MKSYLLDILAAVFLLAIVVLLVRPSSYAPAFLGEFGKALDALVTFAVSG